MCKRLKLLIKRLFQRSKKNLSSNSAKTTHPETCPNKLAHDISLTEMIVNDNAYTTELHYGFDDDFQSPYIDYFDYNKPTVIKYINKSGEHLIEIFSPQILTGSKYLLPPPNTDKQCLVVDLDETLIHSSFIVQRPDLSPHFSFGLLIEGEIKEVFVYFRPYLAEFLEFIGRHYECVLFTASLEAYATTVLQKIDPNNVFTHRLFRDSCSYSSLGLVKDLGRLGRNLNRTLIIDNSPLCYLLHVENAISINTWSGDPNDVELLELMQFLSQMGVEADLLEAAKFFRNQLSASSR